MVGGGLVVFIIVGICIRVIKLKEKRTSVSNMRQCGQNSSAYNNDLLGILALFLVIVMSLVVLAAISFADSGDILNNPDSTLAKIINYSVAYGSIFVAMVLLPGVAIISNPKMREFVKDEIKNIC